MTAPHDRPDADELVAAVREFLEHDVMAATDGRVQFHTRVAINALRMVERELAEGPRMAREHTARLAELGVSDDAELTRAIAEGDFDDRWDDARVGVFEAVVEKLRVANPDYLVDDEGGG
jgi:hypothetical protein